MGHSKAGTSGRDRYADSGVLLLRAQLAHMKTVTYGAIALEPLAS